jgi:general stress protein CsbA
MDFLMTILSFILMFAVIMGAYVLCKKYVFTKVRINKWIPLAIAIVLFAAQIFFGAMNRSFTIVISIFAVIFFLWFMDIMQTGGPKKKEKQIVIKPKAKPNRVKKDK